jgi:hypothetical protein
MKPLKKALYTSDLVRLLMQSNQEGNWLQSISHLAINNYIDNRLVSSGATDCLQLYNPVLYRPTLSWQKSTLNFFQEKRSLSFRQPFSPVAAKPVSLANQEPPAIVGEKLEYTSLQHHFPAIYAVGPEGVAAGDTPRRKAEVLQLKGYLTLFDQMFADAEQKISWLTRLLAVEDRQTPSLVADLRKHLPGKLLNEDGSHKLLKPEYPAALKHESESTYFENMLDHLLARHGEALPPLGNDDFRLKQQMLKFLPDIGSRRAQAWFNPGSNNFSGLHARVYFRMGEYAAQIDQDPYFLLIEHILLVPKTAEDTPLLIHKNNEPINDPYTAQMTVVVAESRLHNENGDVDQNKWLRLQQVLEEEKPEHIKMYVHLVDDEDNTSESAYVGFIPDIKDWQSESLGREGIVERLNAIYA